MKSFCWLHVVVVELQDVPEEEEVLELSSLLHDVMKKVNNSVLWLLDDENKSTYNLVEEFKSGGIDSSIS